MSHTVRTVQNIPHTVRTVQNIPHTVRTVQGNMCRGPQMRNLEFCKCLWG